MAIPSVRALTAAVWAILDGHPQLPVFQSIADPATDPDSGKLLRGYAVLHPGGGDTQQSETNLAQIPDRLLFRSPRSATTTTRSGGPSTPSGACWTARP
jgi:hypothetical protein